ncbi:MAG: hypothetical protein F6K19_17195 [Cyanothece sp. SIO1E1]|nr:hypothetical protein [Cyanothece sp. SIO1E1]
MTNSLAQDHTPPTSITPEGLCSILMDSLPAGLFGALGLSSEESTLTIQDTKWMALFNNTIRIYGPSLDILKVLPCLGEEEGMDRFIDFLHEVDDWYLFPRIDFKDGFIYHRSTPNEPYSLLFFVLESK